MDNIELESLINVVLAPEKINDYCPNGLQIEGRQNVKHVLTGVTASQGLIEEAIGLNVDAILVHHGYFWKGESGRIRGMKGNRIRALVKNDINLYAYHLPLDIHPVLGNNAQLARRLGIALESNLEDNNTLSVAMQGSFPRPLAAANLAELIGQVLNRLPLHIAPKSNKMVKTIGWCTGSGQNFIDLAASKGLDAFISGEISEQTAHSAKELDIHYFAAGHHATERYGVKALGEWLESEHDLTVTFLDIDNPA